MFKQDATDEQRNPKMMRAALAAVRSPHPASRLFLFIAASIVAVVVLTAVPMLILVNAQETPDAPAKPTGLTGTTTHELVTLGWDEVVDSTITGYQVLRWQRGVHSVGDFQVHVDDTGSSDNSYVDSNVEAGARYVYRIKARNAGGLSPRSNYYNARLANAPVTVEVAERTVTGLTLSSAEPGVLNVTWDAASPTPQRLSNQLGQIGRRFPVLA